jgi:hypothetical protein
MRRRNGRRMVNLFLDKQAFPDTGSDCFTHNDKSQTAVCVPSISRICPRLLRKVGKVNMHRGCNWLF